MKASDKNRIREHAQDLKEMNEYYLEIGETRIVKSWITCIREAINYVEPKRSNKLSERRGHYYEATGQDIMEANKKAINRMIN